MILCDDKEIAAGDVAAIRGVWYWKKFCSGETLFHVNIIAFSQKLSKMRGE